MPDPSECPAGGRAAPESGVATGAHCVVDGGTTCRMHYE